MFKIYNLKMDFKYPENGEYLYIITSDKEDLNTKYIDENNVWYEYKIDNFQDLVTNIICNLERYDRNSNIMPRIHEKTKITSKEFIEEYNKHLKDLKDYKYRNLRLLEEKDIIEAYYIEKHWWNTFYKFYFAIAKTKDGYIAFQYTFTA